jgi:hypothetical protein
MSLQTWKKEFYPVPADDVEAPDAIAHSLQKWIGLRPENLKKHGVQIKHRAVENINPHGLEDYGYIPISDSTCSLCAVYFEEDSYDGCSACPLALARGGAACDNPMDGEGMSPYDVFTRSSDPEPMIMLLKKAQELP